MRYQILQALMTCLAWWHLILVFNAWWSSIAIKASLRLHCLENTASGRKCCVRHRILVNEGNCIARPSYYLWHLVLKLFWQQSITQSILGWGKFLNSHMVLYKHLFYAEPKMRERLYFSRDLLLHFRRNGSKFRRLKHAIVSLLCQTGSAPRGHLQCLLWLHIFYVFRWNKTWNPSVPLFLVPCIFLSHVYTYIKWVWTGKCHNHVLHIIKRHQTGET